MKNILFLFRGGAGGLKSCLKSTPGHESYKQNVVFQRSGKIDILSFVNKSYTSEGYRNNQRLHIVRSNKLDEEKIRKLFCNSISNS